MERDEQPRKPQSVDGSETETEVHCSLKPFAILSQKIPGPCYCSGNIRQFRRCFVLCRNRRFNCHSTRCHSARGTTRDLLQGLIAFRFFFIIEIFISNRNNQVCRDLHDAVPPLDHERGERLLSPMVMCGPHGLRFNHPVELRLPHCASMTPDGWSFALKSSDAGKQANHQVRVNFFYIF